MSLWISSINLFSRNYVETAVRVMASTLSYAPLESQAAWNAQTEAETLSCIRMKAMAHAIAQENRDRLQGTRVPNPPTLTGYDARALQGTDGPYARYCAIPVHTSLPTELNPHPVQKTQFLEHTRSKFVGCAPTPC